VGHKEFLPVEQKAMDAAAFVDRAAKMAATLEDREVFDVRSRPIARQRVARFVGVSAALLHSLRYRPPKSIAADAYARLCVAIERCAEAQIRTAHNEILAARACRRGVDDRDLCEVEAALEQARAFLKRDHE
jgi:hypothetical protein